tara:strand:+ start:519 stop:1778 length:1260 start_codon:yes stop_codon:yes gene_type:complete
MFVFKEIDNSSTVIEQNVVSYTQSLNTSSLGINSVNIVSNSISTSYWNSLNVMFYTSGSPVYSGELKFENTNNNLAYNTNKQHLNKFHGYPSSSLFIIPSHYYGEKIKEKTFVLTDKSNASNVIIQDDGYGNLYPVGNTVSHSTNSQTASDNYVGNIFYELGLAVVTETSSYSHTASTGSITVGNMTDPSVPSANHFFLTGSDGTTMIKFISTGSFASETDINTKKYFISGSTAAATAASASVKINNVFGGNHISASATSNVINITNDANLLKARKPSITGANLPPISGSNGFNATVNPQGGVAAINYSDIGTNYELSFGSYNTITTHEYSVTLLPNEFNTSANYTMRKPLSGSTQSFLQSEYLATEFTSSTFTPYITEINLYKMVGEQAPPVLIQAKLPKPIRKSNIIGTTFKIRLDI